jgi:hypothetical protein
MSGRGSKNIEEGTLTDIHGGASGHEDEAVIKAGKRRIDLVSLEKSMLHTE